MRRNIRENLKKVILYSSSDFIVLSDDIFSIDEKEILSVKVEKTFLGGEEVYSC